MTPLISLILPTLGDGDYLSLFFSSLARHTVEDVEVCVSCFGRFPLERTFGVSAKIHEEFGDPGVGPAQNRCIDMSSGEWIAISNDDVVFLPGWDGIRNRMAPDRWAGWILLEPRPGSFPPACEAGATAEEFRQQVAIDEAARRNKGRSEPCGDAGLFLFHRSLWDGRVRYREDMGAFGGQDTDFMWRMFQARPELMYGRLNLCLYHFGGVAIGRRPELRSHGDEFWAGFVRDHGIDPHEAYRAIQERTAQAVSKEPSRWPT